MPAASTVLDGSSPVRRLRGRPQLAGSAQREFATALTRLASDPAAPVQALSASDEAGRKLILVMRQADALTVGGSTGAPAIVVYIGHKSQDLSAGMIRVVERTLGLSPVEARLAILLANGHAFPEIARRLRVTETTARTYCKRALAKTGAQRQAELARLVADSLARLA